MSRALPPADRCSSTLSGRQARAPRPGAGAGRDPRRRQIAHPRRERAVADDDRVDLAVVALQGRQLEGEAPRAPPRLRQVEPDQHDVGPRAARPRALPTPVPTWNANVPYASATASLRGTRGNATQRAPLGVFPDARLTRPSFAASVRAA